MRPIWSGTISFGLVSVPVRMFPATESKELRFHFLHKQGLDEEAAQEAREARSFLGGPEALRVRAQA